MRRGLHQARPTARLVRLESADTMRVTLISRLERLEATTADRTVVYRYDLKALPKDFVGERHVVIVKRESTGSPYCEWCHFEERPGPAPPNSVDGSFRIYLTEDDMAL
jgi:hypothetical protein